MRQLVRALRVHWFGIGITVLFFAVLIPAVRELVGRYRGQHVMMATGEACFQCKQLASATECPEVLPDTRPKYDSSGAWWHPLSCARGSAGGLRIGSLGHDGRPGGTSWDTDFYCEPDAKQFCSLTFADASGAFDS